MVATGRKPAARRADLSRRAEPTSAFERNIKPRHAVVQLDRPTGGRMGKAAAGGVLAGAVLFSGMSMIAPDVAAAEPIGHEKIWPKLRVGDTGKGVVRLQRELSAYGPNVPDTGYFGKQTKKRVKQLERKNGLKVNGIASGSVWHVLLTDGNKVSSPSMGKGGDSKKSAPKKDKSNTYRGKPSLAKGDRGSHVAKLQRELSAYGPNVPATGYYGDQTKSRVKRLERRHDLKVNGVAGASVWKVLLNDGKAPGKSGGGDDGGDSGGNVNNTVWDRLAQCESGGNWSINTGNGYYGGLQFSLQTWRAYGGSGMPHQQSRAEQIRIAEKVQNSQGWGAWPSCSSQLGLR